MTQQDKLARLEDIMDLDPGTLRPDAALADLEEWDSLAALSFVVMMKDDFGRKMTGTQIRAFATVRDVLDAMEP